VKIVFFGTSEFACPALKKLARHPNYEVVGVVTQPDRPKGRSGKPTSPPVKLAALDLHCKVFQPETLKGSTFLSQLKYMRPSFHVVVSYGKILHRDILDLPDYGSFNIHASLLPKYRGAAPIQRAMMEGCDETGITIMKMDEGLDTGDIVLQQSTHIRDTDDVKSLHDRLSELGAELIVRALDLVARDKAQFIVQNNEEASYAQKISREDELINWEKSKRQVWNQIRSLYPGSGAYSYLATDKGSKAVKFLRADYERFASGEPGTIIKIDKYGIHVACPKGAVILKELQLEGKKKMTADEFMRGFPLKVGQRFTSAS
jgi:methionyl-tRNA formyltransferase